MSVPAPMAAVRPLLRAALPLVVALLAALGAVTSSARAADASPPGVATSQAMATAQMIADVHWDTQPCGGHVTTSWTVLAPHVNATSTWLNPVDSYSHPAENSSCSIAFNAAASWDWPKLCTVVVHEFGHLSGHAHSADSHDVMTPTYDKPLPACDTPGPGQRAVVRHGATPPATHRARARKARARHRRPRRITARSAALHRRAAVGHAL